MPRYPKAQASGDPVHAHPGDRLRRRRYQILFGCSTPFESTAADPPDGDRARSDRYGFDVQLRRIGPVGGKLHSARSRNDQIALDLKLYLRDKADLIRREIIRLQKAIVLVAEQNMDVVMPGFTHVQHAQPVLFAHHLLAYAWMLERDKGRIADAWKRADEMPSASRRLPAHLFPSTSPTLRGFWDLPASHPTRLMSVVRPGLFNEFGFSRALMMTHLSRLAEELILWSSSEFNMIRLQNEFTSGSSIMPQKRNPDVAEIIRGETGFVDAEISSLFLTILKGLPLSYNRDLQEDKPGILRYGGHSARVSRGGRAYDRHDGHSR